MQWTDEAIVLGARRHGESSSVVELMTRGHGRHMGLVRGGRGKKLAGVLQPGNSVEATWYARLDEHLGTYTIEATELRAARMIASASALYCINWAAALLRLVPERDPHEALYETLEVILEHLGETKLIAALMVRFELALLRELGFGLDLSTCAATGATQDLIYVSPKSGRAVSRAGGEPYKDRLLTLPHFLSNERLTGIEPTVDELLAGLHLTAFFLRRDVIEPRGIEMPEARAAFARLDLSV